MQLLSPIKIRLQEEKDKVFFDISRIHCMPRPIFGKNYSIINEYEYKYLLNYKRNYLVKFSFLTTPFELVISTLSALLPTSKYLAD